MKVKYTNKDQHVTATERKHIKQMFEQGLTIAQSPRKVYKIVYKDKEAGSHVIEIGTMEISLNGTKFMRTNKVDIKVINDEKNY